MTSDAHKTVTLSEAQGLSIERFERLSIVRFFASLRMTHLLLVLTLLANAPRTFAEVSVVASVDRNQVGLGESLALTINIQGTQSGAQPSIPKVDGLTFAGPSVNQSMSIVNGQVSQSISLTYQVTPSRLGRFSIPALEVEISKRKYSTEPIAITVQKDVRSDDLKQSLFGRIQFTAPQVYVGQTVPLDVQLFIRQGVPVQDATPAQCESDGINYQVRGDRKMGQTVINGVQYTAVVAEGAVTFTKPGKTTFGPCFVKCRLRTPRRAQSLFEEAFGQNFDLREVPVPIDAIVIDVLPLPDDGRPADFSGAVGQWNLEVSAKPTELNVGDPITLTIRISGTGNLDTVPALKLAGLDEFKAYDPTTKSSKNDLSTTGERVIQQVLVPKSAAAKQLPEMRFTFFDPVAKTYKTALQPAIPLTVKAGTGAPTAIVSGGARMRPDEKLGQDIVYLKGDLGAAVAAPATGAPLFWILNLTPLLALAGALGWKQRTDRLRGDVAYARRSRAAHTARKLLAAAATCDQVQRGLQSYLGDRLNIPAAGITAAVVDEQLTPRGVDGTLARELKNVFETCDTARFAGGSAPADAAAVRQQVENLIDELEQKKL